jgi:hypothetical protein
MPRANNGLNATMNHSNRHQELETTTRGAEEVASVTGVTTGLPMFGMDMDKLKL